ncbi:MAG: HEAT repeat domain-containing protein, partial [Lentisphaerota bacterium]
MNKWIMLGLFVVFYATGLFFYFKKRSVPPDAESSSTNTPPATLAIPRPAAAVETGMTAVVSVKQSYEGLTETNLPFSQVAEKFLRYAGYKVDDAPVRKTDLDLEIMAKGTAYASPGKNDAIVSKQPNLSGTISFIRKGAKAQVVAFDSFKQDPGTEDADSSAMALAKMNPPDTGSVEEASSLSLVFNRTFPPRFAELIGQNFGGHPLIAALRDRDPVIRDAAEKALTGIVRANPLDRQVAEMLADIMDDQESLMRARVVKILGNTEDARLIPLFTGSLKDADPLVRANAAEALGSFKEEEVVAPLISVMS